VFVITMNFEIQFLLYMLAGYLLGSVSTAIITCKLMGLPDPRSVGSNNPGATNVLRHGGKKAAIITLFGDMLKGLLPVVVVSQLEPGANAIAMTGAGALLGHIYPVYYGFRGGKGVATFYGALLGFNWLAGLGALAIWGLAALVTKISSLSALTSILASPFLTWYISGSEKLTATVTLMAVLIYWRHRSNIRNIIEGKENRIGPKPK
jgi:acyl phosphate:glycerol-3-phosphate acyltransferase